MLILVLWESAGGEAARARLLKRTRHRAEQIVKKLHEAATALAGGRAVEEVCKGLQNENTRLKRLVAGLFLDKLALKELAEGNR